jgi:hypothetical protein
MSLDSEVSGIRFRLDKTCNPASLELFDPPKYPSDGLDFNYHQSLLMSLVDESSFQPCTVKLLPGGDVLDTTRRITETAPLLEATQLQDMYIVEIRHLLCDLAGLEHWILFDHEVLRYSVGSFFGTHFDSGRLGAPEYMYLGVRGSHVGTLLIVAPSTDAVGGELVVNGSRLGDTEATPFLAFIPLYVAHEVTVLRKGLRIVAKASVCGVWSKDVSHVFDTVVMMG